MSAVKENQTVENNSLMALSDQEYNRATTLAIDFAESGVFPNIKNKGQAMVLILVGKEMGISAMAALTGIHMINGKPVIGANLMAEKIKESGKYTYEVRELTDQVCKIDFLNGEKNIGTSEFTMEDAKKADLLEPKKDKYTGKDVNNWKRYPKNMLFARAISNGQRWFCPEVFRGQLVYTPDEMGAIVNDTGEVDAKASKQVIDASVSTAPSHPVLLAEDLNTIRTKLANISDPEKWEQWICQSIGDKTKTAYSSLEELPAKYLATINQLVEKALAAEETRKTKMNELHANLEAFSNVHQLEHDAEIVRSWIKKRAGVESMKDLTVDQIQSQIVYIKKCVSTQDVDEDFYTFYKESKNSKLETESEEPNSEDVQFTSKSTPPDEANIESEQKGVQMPM
jgi:hypothetical protein